MYCDCKKFRGSFIFLLVFFLLACQKKNDTAFEPIADNTPSNFNNADFTIDNFSIEQLSKSQSQWILNAKRGYVFYESQEAFLQKPDVMYHTSLQETTYIKADEGIYSEKNQQVVLKNNVLVTTDSGRSLSTQELLWDEKQKIVFTQMPVTIRYSNGDTIYGENGLRADQNLDRVELFSARGVHNGDE